MEPKYWVWVCCREWLCLPYMGVGKCGYCGEHPEFSHGYIEEEI